MSKTQYQREEQSRHDKGKHNIMVKSIIDQWEPPSSSAPDDIALDSSPFKYLSYFSSEDGRQDIMDERTFGAYVLMTYGLSQEIYKVQPYRMDKVSSHDLIVRGYSSQIASIHFERRSLARAKTSFTG